MKKQNLQSLENFIDEKVNASEVLGGNNDMYFSPKIKRTGPGTIAGMYYSEDTFFDDNQDGRWDTGESINFHWGYNTETGKI